MSLKTVHIIFISLSILLTLGFGVWGLHDHQTQANVSSLVMGIASFFLSGILIIYFFWFLSKIKKIPLQP